MGARGRGSDGTAVRAVFFDLGGTLMDFRDFAGWSEDARAAGVDIDPEAIGHWYEEAMTATDRAEPPPVPFEEFWRRILEGAAGRPVAAPEAADFLERVGTRGIPGQLFSDVRKCLEELGHRGLPLGVISNTQRTADELRSLLATAGIGERFGLVVSSTTEGVWKPDPEIFRRAVGRIGVPPAHSLYVGDLKEMDARAAHHAGLTGVWLNRRGTGFGIDPPEITSLAELPRLVERGPARP
ncbi:MAG TPA: HAD-IA family hydrolase [Thermoplasmata archaeon]|nr:HAD-IA family hydrolase [Thermoplasmata archaeon]